MFRLIQIVSCKVKAYLNNFRWAYIRLPDSRYLILSFTPVIPLLFLFDFVYPPLSAPSPFPRGSFLSPHAFLHLLLFSTNSSRCYPVFPLVSSNSHSSLNSPFSFQLPRFVPVLPFPYISHSLFLVHFLPLGEMLSL